MTADEYIRSVIRKYAVPRGPNSAAVGAANALYPTIAAWANSYLLDVIFSGSYAKGTAVRGSADVDLFISLSPQVPGTLKEINKSLEDYMSSSGYPVKPRNVALRLAHGGIPIDLVPGRKQTTSTDHSLYTRRNDSWIQTNVVTHIQTVGNSGRLEEIQALKIWRFLNRLEFPSFFLELAVIEAVAGRIYGGVADNFWASLQYVANSLPNCHLVDPANSNNVVSDDLTWQEKIAVANRARQTLNSQQWKDVIW